MKKVILSQKAPQPIGSYSQALWLEPFLFLSGQIPMDSQTKELVRGEIALQTKKVMENIDAVLQSAGMNFQHIIKTTIYLVKMKDFSIVNEVYSMYFTPPFPARSCVAVSELPKGVGIEIEAIAFLEK